MNDTYPANVEILNGKYPGVEGSYYFYRLPCIGEHITIHEHIDDGRINRVIVEVKFVLHPSLSQGDTYFVPRLACTIISRVPFEQEQHSRWWDK